jgi:hypothetical protein
VQLTYVARMSAQKKARTNTRCRGLNRWSVVGDRSEAVMGGAGESRVESGAGVCQAVRGCVLEDDADAAARGFFYGIFGLAIEEVVLQAATGRSQGGEVGMQEHA